MKPARRAFLLALVGALSAVVAFQLAMPFVASLSHAGLSPSDPRARFPLGTKWALVEYIANGALLCGPICFILVWGNRGPKWASISGLLGLIVGGIAGFAANGGADRLGIAAERKFGTAPFVPQAIWSFLVPVAYALTIAIVVGPTPARLRRAYYAVFYAAIFSFLAFVGAEVIVEALVQTGKINLDVSQVGDAAQASIPVWEACAAAAGFAIGAMFARAESASRAASLQLALGRNEGREWNLDSKVSRIGSAEGMEVYLGRNSGTAPVHARIVHHPDGYAVEETGAGPILLNGLPVPGGAYLNNGDTLGIGPVVLIFSSQINARAQGFPPMTSPVPMGQAPIPVPQPMPLPQPMPALQQAPMPQPNPMPMPQAASVAPAPVQRIAPGGPKLIDAFGNAYPLHDGVNSLGREQGVSVNLGWDSSVSRHHAEIAVSPSSVQIRDLGSTNGTRVNSQTVQGPFQLHDGDNLQIGHVSLTFKL